MKSFHSIIAGATVRFHDLPGQGVPVVFIHGLGCASSYEYPRIVADEAFRNRRALLIDLPGSGYSDKPADYSFSVSAQAQVVAELLTHLHIDDCYLYGHSMGGSIAIEAAAAGIPLHIIPDAGHCMSWETPSRLAIWLDAIFSTTQNKHSGQQAEAGA